ADGRPQVLVDLLADVLPSQQPDRRVTRDCCSHQTDRSQQQRMCHVSVSADTTSSNAIAREALISRWSPSLNSLRRTSIASGGEASWRTSFAPARRAASAIRD